MAQHPKRGQPVLSPQASFVLSGALAFGALAACAGVQENAMRASAKAPPAVQSGQALTLDDLFDPKKKVDFSGRPRTSVTWIDGSHWIERKPAAEAKKADANANKLPPDVKKADEKQTDAKKADEKPAETKKADAETKKDPEWVIVEAATGTTAPYTLMSRAQKAVEALKEQNGDRTPAVSLDAMNKDRTAQIVLARKEKPDATTRGSTPPQTITSGVPLPEMEKGDLWVVNFDAGKPVRITETPDVQEEEAIFSPDGKRVAFVADNDLYVGDAVAGGALRITTDGSESVLNGKLDWLYQEEVYGRGTFRSFWWSPDSQSIAFLRIDEAGVPPYTIVDDVPHVPKVETSPYPRPGETNPTVKLGVWSAATPGVRFVDLSAYDKDEPLVVDVSWSPKNDLLYCVQDREQRWLELRAQTSDGQKDHVLLRETSPAWVERNDQSPMWLADGTFLWLSERTGYKHIYRYRDNQLLGPVTGGEWEARTLHGVDEAKGLVYFSGTQRSAIDSDAYVVGLDGKGLKRLTDPAGTHSVSFSPDWTFFTDAWSDLWTPTQVRLFNADGKLVRVMDENKVETMDRYARSKPELLTVKTRDGFEMNAMLVKPVDFDPARKYPVMMFVYAGPHSQTVRNAWGGTTGMFYQLLAQRGVVVWSCDNRTASGKGIQSTWPVYQRMGETELADIEDSLAWLSKQGFVDKDRIGISGWSYGGFMTSYALTHSSTFALGIAGGSVTDWKSYDSIYTERYMRLPKNNEKGYKGTSVIDAADKLHGRLVLVHGQIDDNVHPQNTTRLAYALAKTDADFETFFYPKSRHGVGDPMLVKHWRRLMLREIENTLLAPPRS